MQVMESFLNTILIWEMYVLHILQFIVYEIIIDLHELDLELKE